MPNPSEEQKPKKIYPSRMPGVIHPCKAKGMVKVSMWFDPDRKKRVVQYCKLKKVTLTDLITRIVMKEVNQNLDALVTKWKWERRHILRAKAYRYLLNKSHRLKKSYRWTHLQTS